MSAFMRDRTARSSRSSAPEAETAVDDETATIGGHHPRRSLQLDCEPGPGDESCPVLLMISNRFYCYYYSVTPNAMVTGELDKIMSVSCPNCNGRIEACRRKDGHISTAPAPHSLVKWLQQMDGTSPEARGAIANGHRTHVPIPASG